MDRRLQLGLGGIGVGVAVWPYLPLKCDLARCWSGLQRGPLATEEWLLGQLAPWQTCNDIKLYTPF